MMNNRDVVRGFPRNVARRAGQPDLDGGEPMPNGNVQERAGLLAELQEARAEAARWKAECERLSNQLPSATARTEDAEQSPHYWRGYADGFDRGASHDRC